MSLNRKGAFNFTLLSLVPFFLGAALFPWFGVGGAWFDMAGDASGLCSFEGAGGGGI